MASRTRKYMFKRKKVIVFSFEGKNNKTEKMYFSHFNPSNDDYILKTFSAGVTDIKNMISSTKVKRNEYDYHASEDLTFIFVDADGDKEKLRLINEYKRKQPKDIHIIVSNPTFELWFLNHFTKTSKQMNNQELYKELNKYINNYEKNNDYYDLLEDKFGVAMTNGKYQLSLAQDNPFSEVTYLFDNDIINKK